MAKELKIIGEQQPKNPQLKLNETINLYLGVFNNDNKIIEFYKQNPDALYDPVTLTNDTAFHIAAYNGNSKLLVELLELVPDFRVRDVLTKKDVHGNTPLHELSGSDRLEAGQVLVRKLLVFHQGKKPVHEKDMREREELLKIRNNLGETLIYRAAALGRTPLLKYLISEAEQIGDVSDHFRRNDQISILHIAIIGQHFETGVYLTSKYKELAELKDQNGMSGFHMLSWMPNAFKSSCPREGLVRFIYYCLPTLSDDINEDNNKNDDIGNPTIKPCCIPHGFSRMYLAFWKKLDPEFETVQHTMKLKKTHETANKLAEILAEKDTSWSFSHVPDDNKIIIGGEEGELLDMKSEIKEDENDIVGKKTKLIKFYSIPDTPLLVAASNGITEIIDSILKIFPQSIEHVNRNGHNILHVAIMHRQSEVFEMIMKKIKTVHKLVTAIDAVGNTILHQAADTFWYPGGTRPGAALQLQEELEWFEKVEKIIPTHYKMHRNKDGLTAEKLLEIKHKDQLNEAKEWMSSIAQSCSTVAILVATVVFPAAFTVPGGFRGEDDNNGKNSTSTSLEGLPILLEKPLYSLFTVMTVASLAASLTSVVLFLAILTCRMELHDFLYSVPRKMTFAFNFLFSSLTTAMLAFTSTILLTIRPKDNWTKTLNYIAAFFPICVFIIAQYPLFGAFAEIVRRIFVQVYKIIFPRKLRGFLRSLFRKKLSQD